VTTALVATAMALLGGPQRQAAGFVLPAPTQQAARAAAFAPRRGLLQPQPQQPQQTVMMPWRVPAASRPLRPLRAAADGGEPHGEGEEGEAMPYEALRAEIRDKLQGLFGAMAGTVLGAGEDGAEGGEGGGSGSNAAASLSRTKGGAGGAGVQTRPVPAVKAEAPASTTFSFKELADAPCEHAVVMNPYSGAAAASSVDVKATGPMAKAAASSASASLASGPPSPGAAAALGKAPEPVNENIARISESVPNAWLAVCHGKDLKKGELKKIVVDDKPVCIFRDSTGAVRAISDICLHRCVGGYMLG
jgi:hypothetical protein